MTEILWVGGIENFTILGVGGPKKIVILGVGGPKKRVQTPPPLNFLMEYPIITIACVINEYNLTYCPGCLQAATHDDFSSYSCYMHHLLFRD